MAVRRSGVDEAVNAAKLSRPLFYECFTPTFVSRSRPSACTILHHPNSLSISQITSSKLIPSSALRLVRENPSNSNVTFSVHFFPYQLYPEASAAGEDKYEWYKRSRYGDSDEKMKAYVTLMAAYGESCGIKFQFGGKVANTLPAHRVIQHFQETRGEETADKIINSLYKQYFEEEKHPSEGDTLRKACSDAGIEQAEAERVTDDENEGLVEVKSLIREQIGNGIDSVPYVVVEGKRRDISLQGANEVAEYIKALELTIKESG